MSLDLRIDSERPRIRSVVRNVRESKLVHTVFFKDEPCGASRPGQFVMAWAPGYDEMPMSLSSYRSDGMASVTVKPWGDGSSELAKMKKGAVLGIRGPYGSPFTVEKCNALLVGAGTGLAPLLPLAVELVKVGSGVTVVIGGRTKSEIIFERAARKVIRRDRLFITTDDGSYGIKGFPTDIAKELIVRRRVNRVYTCGPEIMMRKLYDISSRMKGVKFEASLERGMKCGIGICGSCTIGPYLLCRDGPMLSGDKLKLVLDEFGMLQRDTSGRYISG